MSMTLPTRDSDQQRSTSLTPVLVDLDGALLRQSAFLERHAPQTLPYQEHAAALRWWCTTQQIDDLSAAFRERFGEIDGKVVFYGSGDYHHITLAWLRMLAEPVTLIHFDNHSDTTTFLPPRDSCHAGNWSVWVRRAMRDRIPRHLMFGVDGDFRINLNPPVPIGTPTSEVGGFLDGQLEVYPSTMRRTLMSGRLSSPGPSVALKPVGPFSVASWRSIRDEGIETLMHEALDRAPTDAVYVTIDKDCLREHDSFTNYYRFKQGDMPLSDLTTALRIIRERKRIVAVDVNGDGSRPVIEDRGKEVFHKLIYSTMRDEWFDDLGFQQRNGEVNNAILDALGVG